MNNISVIGGIDTIYYSVFISDKSHENLKTWVDLIQDLRKMGQTIIRVSPVSGESDLAIGVFPSFRNTQYKYVIGSDSFKVGMYYTESLVDMASPLYVTLSSVFISEHGYSHCLSIVDDFIANTLELEVVSKRLSRLDLFCDTDEMFLRESYLKYFIRTSRHADFHFPAAKEDFDTIIAVDSQGFERFRKFTGFTFGKRGSSIYSRVYLKNAEIRISEKEYMLDWWKEKGLNIEKDIWRVEFELHRQQLKDLGFTEFSQLDSESLNLLWGYLTNRVLRFIQIPNKKHTERTKPRRVWKKIQNVSFEVKERIKFYDKLPQSFDATIAQIYGLLSKVAVDYSKHHEYKQAVSMDFAIDVVRNYFTEQRFTDKVKERENNLAFTHSNLERYFERKEYLQQK